MADSFRAGANQKPCQCEDSPPIHTVEKRCCVLGFRVWDDDDDDDDDDGDVDGDDDDDDDDDGKFAALRVRSTWQPNPQNEGIESLLQPS